MTQDEALTILQTGANVFLTGEPGSGKTHTVNAYVRYLRDRNIEPAITASTGIAATHIGGVTIHSWSGIGIKAGLDEYELDAITSNEGVVKRVRKTRVLIIDEVSMLAPETLGMVDMVLRAIQNPDLPFGGIQVILVGDFFQLPPVMKNYQKQEQGLFGDQKGPRFAYNSAVWSKLQLIVCYLTEQHRQDDSELLSILTAIRADTFDEAEYEYIQSRKVESGDVPASAPKLFTHNADVDRVNDELLAELKTPGHTLTMTSFGPPALVAGLKKGCLSPESLTLKEGAQVMFTKNNPREGFVNGTLGVVVGFSEYDHYPRVQTRDGREIIAEPSEWVIEEGGVVRASVSQVPLRLAWAITVHKSQGMSLDEAVVDLSRVFEYGQGYVALSRVRRLSGLYVLGWNERTFKVHPEVLQQDMTFRHTSAEAEKTFAAMQPKDLTTLHANFVRASGGAEFEPDTEEDIYTEVVE